MNRPLQMFVNSLTDNGHLRTVSNATGAVGKGCRSVMPISCRAALSPPRSPSNRRDRAMSKNYLGITGTLRSAVTLTEILPNP
jgi:hypothetical protein